MSNKATAPLDLDNMSDEEVSALSPEQVNQLMEQESEYDAENAADEGGTTVTDVDEDEDKSDDEDDETSSNEDEPKGTGDVDEPATEDSGDDEDDDTEGSDNKPEDSVDGEEGTDPKGGDADSKGDDKSSKDEPAGKEKPAKTEDGKKKSEEAGDAEAVAFYKTLTSPIKANGKTITIRSAEDAVRLIQMGTNYSKRMEELKPVRALGEMLEQHGLSDPAKLSFLIDVQAGKPEAIQKLLKEHKIDPLDIDVTKEDGYVATNYTPDEKVSAFKDAIQDTLAQEGGPELIQEITSDKGYWDEDSKEALKESPEIFNSLLDQRKSGMYTQITEELAYQKTLGHLANVPFLQAYHAVGQAMDKAGVFSSQTKETSTSINATALIDTGPRKAAAKKPTPNLSSTSQPRTARKTATEVKDYSSMSDEDFKKMGPPS